MFYITVLYVRKVYKREILYLILYEYVYEFSVACAKFPYTNIKKKIDR